MIGRFALQAKLDAAVEQRTITLVQGLPRVGRSRFITDWVTKRPDVVMHSHPTAHVEKDMVVVLDHFDQGSVPALVDAVRAAQATGTRNRFVVLPTDLATSFAIRDALVGTFETIDVMPLRPDEVAHGTPILSAAMGPLVPSASPNAPVLNSVQEGPYRHWLRGGFPESLTALSDQASLTWRRQLLEPLLERDYGRCGLYPAYPLKEVLIWLAQRNSSEIDDSNGRFGTARDFKAAVFALEKLGLIRRLPNIVAVDNPESLLKDKLFVRDSGLLHALLGIVTVDQLVGHKAVGASFESYAIEALVAAAGDNCEKQFYRYDHGSGWDEIDLILDLSSTSGRRIAIEFKVNPSKRPKLGFLRACSQMGISEQMVVHSGPNSILNESVPRFELKSAMRKIAAIAHGE